MPSTSLRGARRRGNPLSLIASRLSGFSHDYILLYNKEINTKKSRGAVGDIAVVALDMNRGSVGYAKFEALSAEQKIALIAERITNVCNDLKQIEPNAMWLITWREYGITDGFERSLSADQKRLFKNTMQTLAKQFAPNLTIAAGTIASQKHVADFAKIRKIKEAYDSHAWIKEREKRLDFSQQHILKEEGKIKKVFDTPETENVTVVRNTAYVFGEETWRHDKIAPILETKETSEPEYFELFQPGKGRNLSPICKLRHPITKEEITLGVEICREHDFENLLRHSNRPYFQLIMSDSISVKLDKICGEYIIPLDSDYKPRLYTKKQNTASLPVRLYQSDMTTDVYQLTDSLEPSYPFEMQVFDKVTQAIYRLAKTSDNRATLNLILSEFLKAIYENKGKTTTAVYDALESAINKHKKDLISENTKLNTMFASPNVSALLQELEVLIERERLKKLEDCNFLGKTEALLADKVKLFETAIADFDEKNVFLCLNNYDVLSRVKLSVQQVYLLLQILHNNAMPEAEKSIHYQRIIQHAYPIILQPQEDFNGKNLINLLCETNILIPLRIILPLLQHEINAFYAEGHTLLYHAIQENADEEVIALLLENGANLHLPDNKSALQLAKELNHPALPLMLKSTPTFNV